jgi:AcrR family transcriptional regulator
LEVNGGDPSGSTTYDGAMTPVNSTTVRDSGSPRPPGRPRDQAVDAAILKAAEQHLRERGYPGMSLEAVASSAGTTIPSLRRRYRDKSELVAAVIDSLRVQPIPDATADPRADALSVLENFRTNLLRPSGMATLGTIIAEERRNPALLEHFRQRLVEPRRDSLRQALATGVEQGSLPADLDLDAAVSLLIGSFYARYLSHQSIPRDWAKRTLAMIWPADTSRKR